MSDDIHRELAAERRRADQAESSLRQAEKALRRHEDEAFEKAAEAIRQADGFVSGIQRRKRGPGRPKGSGMMIKSRGYLLGQYGDYRVSLGREPDPDEFAGHLHVSRKTLDKALKAFDLPWPPDGSGN